MKTVEQCRSIDMKDFVGHVNLELVCSGSTTWTSGFGQKIASIGWKVDRPRQLTIHYTISSQCEDKEQKYAYRVGCTTTPCNYGGVRYWYQCPSCGSRRRILYLPPGRDVFACRDCHRLTYKSRQEAKCRWEPLFTYVYDVPKWEKKLMRTRSPLKRKRLIAKISRAGGEIETLGRSCAAEDRARRIGRQSDGKS